MDCVKLSYIRRYFGCFIIDPYAYIAGYFIVGYIVAGVGVLLGLVWLFSRFKWGRKYWWALLLGLFLIQIVLEQYGGLIINKVLLPNPLKFF